MFQPVYFIIFVLCFVISLAATGLVLKYLQRKEIVDVPNQRSNHKGKVPRGGGVAVIGVTIISYIIVSTTLNNDLFSLWPLFLGIILLAAVSLMDDIKTLRIHWRLLAQIIAVALGITVLLSGFDKPSITGFIPLVIESIILGLIWLWFINLYNFMDGIDGITGSETIAIAAGIVLITIFHALPGELILYSAIPAAACLGFLLWNWHPARIFIGDVGSIPLGYVLGWLLLEMVVRGFWVEALIIPGYYLADSTYTLASRLLRGKKIWEAHSEHFYQKAVRAGKRHSRVVVMVSLINILLIILASAAAANKDLRISILLLSYILIAGIQYYFSHSYKKFSRQKV